VEDRYASAVEGPEGFNIDIADAKVFRDMEHRLAVLLRKRYGPSEDGGLTAADSVEKTELGALVSKRAAEFVCPPGANSKNYSLSPVGASIRVTNR
jgi:hypothetical protein